MYDADKLENKIDRVFQKKICEPRRTDIVQFFTNLLSSKEGFQLLKEKDDLEVIDVFYYANAPLEYLFAMACLEFYDEEHQLDSPTLRLDAYHDFNIEDLVKEVVLDEDIQLNEDERENFDSANYWENQHELEMEFLIDCWREARAAAPSGILGFLHASDSSGSVIDLNQGEEINSRNVSPVEEYLSSLDINPKKMLIEREEEEEEESPSFWSRLFGRKTN